MTMADKPDKFPDWALEEQVDPVSGQLNRVEPPEFRKETGWQRREIPPRQWFNWQAWLTGKWIRWIVPILEGLGSMATRNAGTGSSQFRTNSQNDDRYNHRSNNLSDLTNASDARSNLGLGSAATQDDDRYNHRSNNLSDVDSASSARDNLGLGSEEEIRALAGIVLSRQVVTAGGDFSGSNNVICSRVGNTVTITSTGLLSHTAASSADSVAGAIPSEFRPASSAHNIYMSTGSESSFASCKVRINSAGQINVSYSGLDGSPTSRANTVVAVSITYAV